MTEPDLISVYDFLPGLKLTWLSFERLHLRRLYHLTRLYNAVIRGNYDVETTISTKGHANLVSAL